jgi:AcrR family transcriptional regulator
MPPSNRVFSTPVQPKRLDPDSRREHLMSVGAALFAEQAYDDVLIDEIARRAEVSRGLLYHYFPNKREFFVAILKLESSKLAAATDPDPALAPLERLHASLEGYFRYVEGNRAGYRAIFRGSLSADAKVRAIVQRNVDREASRLLAGISPREPPSELLELVVYGWLAFLVATTLRWLDNERLAREQLRELCVGALMALVERV